jgi:hypothetical protein
MTKAQENMFKVALNYGTPLVILLVIMFGAWRSAAFFAPRVDQLLGSQIENINEQTTLWRQVAKSAEAAEAREVIEHEWMREQTEILRRLRTDLAKPD